MGRINLFSFLFLIMVVCAIFFIFQGVRDPNFAAASATFAALATVAWTMRDNTSREEESTSRFYLDKYEESIKKACALISDNNRDRIKWILAARIIGIANSIEENINQRHHLEILEAVKLEYRNKLSHALGVKNDNVHPAFFYGSVNNIPLKEAQQIADHLDPIIWDYSGKDPYQDIQETKELSEKSIATIYRYTIYPKDFEDKIGDEFSDLEIHDLGFSHPKIEHWIKYKRMIDRQRQNHQ